MRMCRILFPPSLVIETPFLEIYDSPERNRTNPLLMEDRDHEHLPFSRRREEQKRTPFFPRPGIMMPSPALSLFFSFPPPQPKIFLISGRRQVGPLPFAGKMTRPSTRRLFLSKTHIGKRGRRMRLVKQQVSLSLSLASWEKSSHSPFVAKRAGPPLFFPLCRRKTATDATAFPRPLSFFPFLKSFL